MSEIKDWEIIGIDKRIASIMEKAGKLSAKNPEFPCGEFPPKWDKPLSEAEVAQYERENGITLPKDYRRFITTVAAGGTQPFYGMYSLVGKLPEYDTRADMRKKFPYTVRKPLNISKLSEEEYDALYEDEENKTDCGYVLLCHEGCGMYSILIVNTYDEDTYGTVWFYDLANDWGIYPLINPLNKKTMNFIDWLEYYVDQTLKLDDSQYFSYGELSGFIEN